MKPDSYSLFHSSECSFYHTSNFIQAYDTFVQADGANEILNDGGATYHHIILHGNFVCS